MGKQITLARTGGILNVKKRKRNTMMYVYIVCVCIFMYVCVCEYVCETVL